MSLRETTAHKVIALFSYEKPDWIGKLQCIIQPDEIPIVGGLHMISRSDQKRFKTTKLRRKNPGIKFFRIEGNRTGFDESLRNILPTLGKNISQPKLDKNAAQPYAAAMRAFFRPPNKYRSFTFQKKRYKIIMLDGEPYPWRWHFDHKQYYRDLQRRDRGAKISVCRHDYMTHHVMPLDYFIDSLFDEVSVYFPTEFDNYTVNIYEPEGFSPNASSNK